MFTCSFEKQCMQAEEEAKKKHFGQATGLKYCLRNLPGFLGYGMTVVILVHAI